MPEARSNEGGRLFNAVYNRPASLQEEAALGLDTKLPKGSEEHQEIQARRQH